MFPLYDQNPTKTRPYVTWMLVAANVAVFLLQLSRGFADADFLEYGAIPGYLMHGERLYTLFTSMFMHGGLWHIIGNMLFLFIFGDNVEDRFGHIKFLILYLMVGVISGLAHAWITFQFDPSAAWIPAVGASGAVSGVLGAYLLFFPGANIVTLVFLFYIATTVKIKAIFYLGFWFLLQFSSVILNPNSGVAYWAHIGGFAAGLLVAVPFKMTGQKKTQERARFSTEDYILQE
ncbi:MAG: rhomboid family intramembrane serine protease [Candidatus Bathyarchaeota archaeon]|nr:MAG: rhomboid family intramembrane serine protease [Candidatus Bathyarchaeota archaeon]